MMVRDMASLLNQGAEATRAVIRPSASTTGKFIFGMNALLTKFVIIPLSDTPALHRDNCRCDTCHTGTSAAAEVHFKPVSPGNPSTIRPRAGRSECSPCTRVVAGAVLQTGERVARSRMTADPLPEQSAMPVTLFYMANNDETSLTTLPRLDHLRGRPGGAWQDWRWEALFLFNFTFFAAAKVSPARTGAEQINRKDTGFP